MAVAVAVHEWAMMMVDNERAPEPGQAWCYDKKAEDQRRSDAPHSGCGGGGACADNGQRANLPSRSRSHVERYRWLSSEQETLHLALGGPSGRAKNVSEKVAGAHRTVRLPWL